MTFSTTQLERDEPTNGPTDELIEVQGLSQVRNERKRSCEEHKTEYMHETDASHTIVRHLPPKGLRNGESRCA